jgi:hypothetical protein
VDVLVRPRRLSDGTYQAGTRRGRHARGARGSQVRADVRLTAGGGYIRRFSSWQEVAEWIQGDQFAADIAAVNSIRLINLSSGQDSDGQPARTPGSRPA